MPVLVEGDSSTGGGKKKRRCHRTSSGSRIKGRGDEYNKESKGVKGGGYARIRGVTRTN